MYQCCRKKYKICHKEKFKLSSSFHSNWVLFSSKYSSLNLIILITPSSPPEINPLPSLKNYIEFIGPKCPLIFPTSFSCIMLQMWASKPECELPAAKTAGIPPPIAIWNLGAISALKSGETATAFIGNSCLKNLIISIVSGSRILEPLLAAVASTAKFLLKAIELILFSESCTNFLLITFPFISVWIIHPSVVAINKLSLSTYHNALDTILLGLASLRITWKSATQGMFYASCSVDALDSKIVLKSKTFIRDGTFTLYSSRSNMNLFEPKSNYICFNL